MTWFQQEIIEATQGKLTKDLPSAINDIVLDHRSVKKGDLFVAIKGQNHDGHEFVSLAAKAGASAALVSTPSHHSLPQITTKDTLTALSQMAIAARKRSQAKVIAVTGSVGKTGTCRLVAACLATQGITHASKGNLNNHIGAPLSLARMPQETEFAVFELGMNHAGEIAKLTSIIAPDIAVITRIAESHSANFNKLDDIAKAKAEIFDGLTDGGCAIINADDPFADLLTQHAHAKNAHIITVGFAEDADARIIKVVRNANGLKIDALIFQQKISYYLSMYEEHWALSATIALAITHKLNGDINKAAHALTGFENLEGRGKRHYIRLNEMHSDQNSEIVLIDDSYNASPASMQAAIASLGQEPGCRRIAVLADMLELGKQSYESHQALVEHIVKAGINIVITYGAYMRSLHDALPQNIQAIHCVDAEDATMRLIIIIEAGDHILVKGSNGMKSSQIVQQLFNTFNQKNIEINNGGRDAI